ncbi:MAG TPA: hypothetical protein VLZ75_07390 [Chitinophagales bacterium]|nr:hypothetical protein [Chitinophagales bacterium]
MWNLIIRFFALFLTVVIFCSTIHAQTQQTEQTEEEFLYRYRVLANELKLKINAQNIEYPSEGYQLGILLTVEYYYHNSSNNTDQLITKNIDLFNYNLPEKIKDGKIERVADAIYTNDNKIENKIVPLVSSQPFPRKVYGTQSRTGEYYYSRPINSKEIKPENVKVKVRMRPYLFKVGTNIIAASENIIAGILGTGYLLLEEREITYNVADYIEVNDNLPECKGLLVPSYIEECSKTNFSPGLLASDPDNNDTLSFTCYIVYECYQPTDNIAEFMRLAIPRAMGGNFNINNNTYELSEYSQYIGYCNDANSISDGTSVTNCATNIAIPIITKTTQPIGHSSYDYSRQMHDIIGQSYFVFYRNHDYLSAISGTDNSRSNPFYPCDVNSNFIEYDDNLFHNNKRTCNDVGQFFVLDRASGTNNFRETDYFNLLEWNIFMRVEPYYGGTETPVPEDSDFFPIYQITKPTNGEEHYSSGYTINPIINENTEMYFNYENDFINEDVCNSVMQASNFYSYSGGNYAYTCPPLKLMYQDIKNGQDENPRFIRYQFMVSHTYEDLRSPSEIILEGVEQGNEFLTFRSEILTELKAFPDIQEVTLEVSYPCKNDEEIAPSGNNGLGEINITNVVGGRPKICDNYPEGHSYELYGKKMSCEDAEFYSTYFPNYFQVLSQFYNILKSNKYLHHLGDNENGFVNKFFPKEGVDYNYDGIFKVSCGVYWIRAITNSPIKPRYSGIVTAASGITTKHQKGLVNGTRTYDVTPWNEPIIITAKDVAPVTLTYLPSICSDAPYLLQAGAPEDYVSNIDYWKWEPPKFLDGNGSPLAGESDDEDKKMIFPNHIFCDQRVTGVYENGCISTASIEVPDFTPPLLDPLLLQNVLTISATKMQATWLKDFIDERFEDADGYRAIIDKNLYSSGQLGSYKILSGHDYLDKRIQTTNVSNNPIPDLKEDGVINDVVSFNWTHPRFETTFPKWVNNGRILKYNSSGQAIESVDLMGNFASVIFGFDGSIPVGVAINSRNREIGFEGFEEYPVSGTVTPLNNMQGNLDIFNEQEDVILDKYHTYNILAGSGRYVLTDIPEGKYGSSDLANVIIEVQVPAEINSLDEVEKKSKSGVYHMSAGILKDFCYDFGLMLELPESIFDAADRCEYWQGNIHIVEQIDVESKILDNISIVKDIAHTGSRSLKIEPCNSAPISMSQNVLELSEGKEYILSAWIKTTSSELLTPNALYKKFKDADMGIGLDFYLGTSTIDFYLPNGAIIEGWQKLEHTFKYPIGAKKISFVFKNSDEFYLDDVRIFPKEGNMQTYVYDPSTYRLDAILDQNNFATIYKYDDEGKLFQVKKETAEGIKTLQVNQSHIVPKP